MAPPRRSELLLGRHAERQALDDVLDQARSGRGAVLVVRGEAGIGKSALLHYCAERASGFQVRSIAGVESEMELPFAGLHQLCAPLLDRLSSLPHPQQHALQTALGLAPGDAPDRFLVALAGLSLLSEVAAQQPLLCVVDDVQWLDAASAQVLGFVARRLLADSVAMVFAERDARADRELVGLPELTLSGLAAGDARALLKTVIPGRLEGRVLDRLVAETRGNPLALLELPHRLSATQLPGGFGLLADQDLPRRIEESFQQRLDSLSADARLLLLVAAAEPADDPLLVWRAGELLGVAAAAATGVTGGEDLLAIDEQVRFRHPLVRSAIYGSAAPQARRAVHLALAEATDPEIDSDRRAWHLAAAASGPDEQIASELERSAGRAQARGGLAATAAFLRRSVALTRDGSRRAQRALAAAQASLHAGEFDAALTMLSSAEGRLDELQRVRVDLLHAQVMSAAGVGGSAPALLLRAAQRLEALDAKLARETYLDAWGAAFFAGNLATSPGTLSEVSTAARSASRESECQVAPDLMLDGLTTLVTDGRAAAVPVLKRAVSAFRAEGFSVQKGLQWGVLASSAAAELWDFDSWETVITRQMELARDAGALAPLSIAINGVGIVVAWRGDLAKAAGVIVEADAITEVTRTRIAPYGAMVLAALRGREAEMRARMDTTIEIAAQGGDGLAVQWAHWAAAMLYNGLGHYQEALTAARTASDDTPDLYLTLWALVELVEAASRSETAPDCTDAVDRLLDSARVSGSDWGLGIAARSQALLSHGDTAERLYREAIERLGVTQLRPETARAHLLYGEWLRREQRRVEARTQLRTAFTMFTAMGANGFAQRARHELQATGTRVLGSRPAMDREELTPQEEHIARLAGDGRTNVQIGTELFLSPRTVEWHLNKVFIKLGISSRRELSGALPGRVDGVSFA